MSRWWRPPALGLAAAVFCAGSAVAQPMPLAERITLCGTCHGEDGNSRMQNIPSLAGQPEFYVLNQLFLMREGVRRIEVMTPFVKDLKDDEMDALAKHYAKLAPKPSDEPTDPALVQRGTELANARRCGSCHLPSLAGQDQMPRLAKQRIDYLIRHDEVVPRQPAAGRRHRHERRRRRPLGRRPHRARALRGVAVALITHPCRRSRPARAPPSARPRRSGS